LLWDETEETLNIDRESSKPIKMMKFSNFDDVDRNTKQLGYTISDFMKQQKYKVIEDRLPIMSETFTC